MRHGVDAARHRPGFKHRRCVWKIKASQPFSPSFLGTYNRHPVVYATHVFICGARDDDAAVVVVQTCKCKQGAIPELKIIWLPAFPLVKSVGRNQASVFFEQLPEHGPFRKGLAAGIDNHSSRLRILKAPYRFVGSFGLVLPDDRNFLRRSDVVAALEQRWKLNGAEFLEHFLTAFGLSETSAHNKGYLTTGE